MTNARYRKYVRRLQTACALSALTVVLLVSCSPRHKASSKQSASTPDKTPSVDAEIVGIAPSPNYTRVALVLVAATEKARKYEIAIFDPESQRIVNRAQVNDDYFYWSDGDSLAWSPDSNWLAVGKNEGHNILILGKDGGMRVLSVHQAGRLRWRGDSPSRLFCGAYADSAQGRRVYCEFDADSGRTRTLPLKRDLSDLMSVRGKPCGWYATGCWEENRTDFIHVVEVESGRELFAVPLFNTAGGWDLGSFDVSPDGKYFYLGLWASANTRDVVARVQDASTVFRNPLQAVLWQDDVFGDISSVDWLRTPSGVPLLRDTPNQVIVRSKAPFFLDLQTGSRKEVMWNADKMLSVYHAAELWKPGEAIQPGHPNQYVVVTDAGLELRTDNDEPPPVLLLRHRMQKPRQ